MRNCQVVSAPFASGVAWLINLLLELGIRTTHVASRHPEKHWLPKGETVEIGPAAYDHLRWHLPVLLERKEFLFEPGIEVFWEHRLDFARHPQRPTILFVRDPRDAIYSLYRRDYEEHYTFHEYLSRPATWPYHFPAMFRLPPADTWAYFHLFWLGMRQLMQIKIVTFEEARARPVEITEEILQFLGVTRTRDQIQLAVERSSFDRARAAVEALQEQTGRRWRTARKGKAGEWKETYDEAALQYFRGPAAHAMRLLGYSPPVGADGAEELPPLDLLETESEPDALEPVARAKQVYRQGNPMKALALLSETANSCGDDPLAALAVASTITSLLWISYIFSRDLVASPQGQLAFDTFCKINQHFGYWEPVQDAMLTTVSLDNPLVRHTPAVIEQDYRGFNFALWHDRYYAFNMSLPVEALAAAGEDTLAEYEDSRLWFSAESLTAVMAKVDSLDPGDQPRLVEEGYGQFNIVSYRRRFHGISQSVGQVDLARMAPSQLRTYVEHQQWFIADSPSEVKQRVATALSLAAPSSGPARAGRQTRMATATPVLQEVDPALWRDHLFGLTPERWALMQGRSYWVTGAGTGYGRALSCALGAAGAQLFLTGRRVEKLQETVEEIRSLGIPTKLCHIIEADLTDLTNILEAYARVKKLCSALDGLVNNAAVPSKSASRTPLLDDPVETWDRMMDTNVKAAWFLTRTAFPLLRASGNPRVLFISSEAGWASTPGFGMYNISKAALNSLSHSLAQEAARAFPKEDIQINSLIPGEARTEISQGSTRSPSMLASMALILLSHPKGGPNGRFFHQDGRHFAFGHTGPYEHPLM